MSKTLRKGLLLLSLFDEHHPVISLSDLSKKSGISKPTVLRLLKVLEEFGYIEREKRYGDHFKEGNHYYKLGFRCIELGSLVLNRLELREIALPFMKQLRDTLGESVQLAIRDNNKALYIEKVESHQAVRLYTKIGRSAPLHAGACPRILLSFMEDDEIKRLLTDELIKVTPETITDSNILWSLIHQTRKQGFTHSISELEMDTTAIAVPVFDRLGNVIASLSVAGPCSRISNEKISLFVTKMWDAASVISRYLGYPKSYPYNKLKER